MPRIARAYPGKSADEIYQRVHRVMREVAETFSLDYRTDAAARTGSVSRMGASGAYRVSDGEVVVEFAFPLLVPGAMRRKVEAKVGEKLDELFA